mgnify:CR=1 FL=1
MRKRIWLLILSIVLLSSCSSNKFDTAFNSGLKYLNEGDYAQAIVFFTEAISIEPKNTEAYIQRATTYVYNHEYENAVEDFIEVKSIDESAYDENAILDLFNSVLEKDVESIEEVYTLLIDNEIANNEALKDASVFKEVSKKKDPGLTKYLLKTIREVEQDLGSNYELTGAVLGGKGFEYSQYDLFFWIAYENDSWNAADNMDAQINTIISYGNHLIGYGLDSRMTYTELSTYAQENNAFLATLTTDDFIYDGYYRANINIEIDNVSYAVIYLWSKDPYTTQSDIVLISIATK